VVSTETEDDPVNMAMRATLGGSSTDGEEVDDGEEEVILWGSGLGAR
jgi:protein SMG7